MEIAAILIVSAAALSGAVFLYYRYSLARDVIGGLNLALLSDARPSALEARKCSYFAYVPANLPPQSALVIVLHGAEMDGEGI